MEKSTLLILTLNFLYVALLPVVFFRRDGKFTLMWAVTAAPWGIAPVIFITQYYGIWTQPLLDINSSAYSIMSGIATVLNLASIALISLTIGGHRIPLALWHQNPGDDAPGAIVTWGSYKYIRHPFYSAFILAFVACAMISPHWTIFLLAAYTFLLLNYTANKEEKRLSSEPGSMGEEYREYIKHTGRFFPKLLGGRDAVGQRSTQ